MSKSISSSSDVSLDEEQKAAVRAFLNGKNVLVEAPPGTGKTFLGVVLAVCALRKDLLPAHAKALFLTFSKNARVQIERQADDLVTSGRISHVEQRSLLISNYHSFFLECLQSKKGLWGIGGKLRLSSWKGRKEALSKLYDGEAGIDYPELSSALALKRFTPNQLFGGPEKPNSSDLIQEAFDTVVKSLRAGRIYYDDFAPLVLDLLETSPSFVEYLRARYPIVILDEFQDTDHLQWEILTKWRPPRMAVLYDRFQMIYEWRGSSAERLFDLKAQFGPFAEQTLTTVHRTTGPARGLATFLIALREDNLEGKAVRRLPPTEARTWLDLVRLPAKAGEKDNTKIRKVTRIEAWLRFRLVASMQERKTAAVITRGNELGSTLHRRVSQRPSTVKRPFFACRRIATKASAEETLRDWIDDLPKVCSELELAGWFGSGLNELTRGSAIVKSRGVTSTVDFHCLAKDLCSGSATFSKGLARKGREFWSGIETSLLVIAKRGGATLFAELGQRLGELVELSYQICEEFGMKRDPDVVYLVKSLARIGDRAPTAINGQEAADRLGEGLLQASFLLLRRSSTAPVFLSAHQSKGREFDHVIIPWLSNTKSPEDTKGNVFGKVSNDVASTMEERRLLYVALSRAKERVTIYYPEESPSRMLYEWGLLPEQDRKSRKTIGQSER
jgi:superfamily I DNA/RNA helicase